MEPHSNFVVRGLKHDKSHWTIVRSHDTSNQSKEARTEILGHIGVKLGSFQCQGSGRKRVEIILTHEYFKQYVKIIEGGTSMAPSLHTSVHPFLVLRGSQEGL